MLSYLKHLAHVFSKCRKRIHTLCLPQLFVGFWVYIFPNGVYGVITASRSAFVVETKIHALIPPSSYNPSLQPPSLLVIFRRFWKLLPHFCNKPPLNAAISRGWLPKMFPLTGLLKTHSFVQLQCSILLGSEFPWSVIVSRYDSFTFSSLYLMECKWNVQ